MNEQSNTATVQGLYAAFGRNDIEAILAAVDADAEWTNAGPPEIPYAGERRGVAQVRQFFETLGANVEVGSFEPREYFASGDRVAVFGSWSGRAKPTGKPYTSDWAMTWTLNNGKVTSFRSYEDTHAMVQAFSR